VIEALDADQRHDPCLVEKIEAEPRHEKKKVLEAGWLYVWL